MYSGKTASSRLTIPLPIDQFVSKPAPQYFDHIYLPLPAVPSLKLVKLQSAKERGVHKTHSVA
jgi:hypothetical protein